MKNKTKLDSESFDIKREKPTGVGWPSRSESIFRRFIKSATGKAPASAHAA